MKVDLYEKIWMVGAALIILAFMGSVAVTSYAMHLHPPSHVETIDPTTLATDPRFATRGVKEAANGGVTVVLVAQTWSYDPGEITVPVGRPVTFRITSPDVIHGFEIVGTNVNAMIVPGYVSQLTTTFQHPGEYLLLCHEYCGLGHHMMQGKVIVTGGGS